MKNVKAATLVALIWLVNILPVSGEVADSIDYPHGGSHVREIGAGVGHLGLDISATANYEFEEAAKNDAVYAPCNANIFDSGWHSGYAGTIIAELVRPDGNKDVWLCGHLDVTTLRGTGQVRKGELIGRVAKNYQQKNNDGHNNKLVDRINLNENIDWNGEGEPHVHFAIRKGPHPGGWVYPGYEPNDYGQTKDNFYAPSWYIANYHTFGGNDDVQPPAPQPGYASLAACSITDLGEKLYRIKVELEYHGDDGSGCYEGEIRLSKKYGNGYRINYGVNRVYGNPRNQSLSAEFDLLSHLEEAIWEVYVWAKASNGKEIEQDSGKRITVSASTSPPIKINSSVKQLAADRVEAMLHGQAQDGRRFMKTYEVCLLAGERWLTVGSTQVWNNPNPVTINFNPQSWGLYPGDYQLGYRLVDVWNKATDILPLSNWINVQVEMNWCWAVDLSGRIAVRRQMPDGSWMSWSLVDGALANIDVARLGSHQLICGSDPQGGIWTRRSDGRGMSNWLHHTDGQARYGPTVVEHNGLVYLLVVGTDNSLYIRVTSDGLTWSRDWYKVSDGKLYQSVTAISFEGNIHLFGVDQGGGCYRTIWNTRDQPHWQGFDGNVNHALAVTRVGSQLLILAAAGDSLYTRGYQNGWFTSNWQNLDGAARSDPDMSSCQNQVSIGLVGQGLPLYYRTLPSGWQGWGGQYLDAALADGRAW